MGYSTCMFQKTSSKTVHFNSRQLYAALLLLAASLPAAASPYVFTKIEYPGAIATYAYGLNDVGDVVGMTVTPMPILAYHWDGANYFPVALPPPFGSVPALYAINDLRQAVGYEGTRGFVIDLGSGSFTELTYPGATSTTPYGINNSGQVVGSWADASNLEHGFLWQAGSFSSIDFPKNQTFQQADVTSTIPGDINNLGQVAGHYTTGWGTYGFRYDGGTFTSYTAPWLGEFGATTTMVAINDSGVMLGATYRQWATPRVFLYQNGVYTDLTSQGIPGNSGVSGLNNAGQIVGTSSVVVPCDGSWCGFLATAEAVPEPGAMLLVGSGLLATALLRRRATR